MKFVIDGNGLKIGENGVLYPFSYGEVHNAQVVNYADVGGVGFSKRAVAWTENGILCVSPFIVTGDTITYLHTEEKGNVDTRRTGEA